MKGSEFIFHRFDLLYYQYNTGSSYADSPKWLKNKKATMNPKNNDDKYFQYSLTVALNYQNIKKEPQRIPKINPFINQYDWKEMDFSSEQKDWKTFELNNKTIALNILFTP